MKKVFKILTLTVFPLLLLPSLLIGNEAMNPQIHNRVSSVEKVNNIVDFHITLNNGRDLKSSLSREILWSQIPDTFGGAYACQLDTIYPFKSDIVDDVTPVDDWEIDSIKCWMTGYNGFVSVDSLQDVHFKVYMDSAALSPHPVDSPFVNQLIPKAMYTTNVYDSTVTSTYFSMHLNLVNPVYLTGGNRYWIEIQPMNIFTVNGQTMWVGDTLCGNGQPVYLRSAVLGYDEWTLADSIWNLPVEVGFILYGLSSGIDEEEKEDYQYSLTLKNPGIITNLLRIFYTIPSRTALSLNIFDITGRNIYSFNAESVIAGSHEKTIDLKIKSGIYFIELKTPYKSITSKFIVL